jgi:hypothetical protein
MLRREATFLFRQICLVSGVTRLSNIHPIHPRSPCVRSMAAVTKTKATTKQLWRKTRKKVGPSTKKKIDLELENILPNIQRVVATPEDRNVSLNTEISDPVDNIAPQEYNWVPPAYRGIAEDSKKKRTTSRNKPEHIRTEGSIRPRKVRPPPADRYILHLKDGVIDVPVLDLPEQAILAKQQKEESIIAGVNDLIKVASSYRKHFRDDTVVVFDNENGSPMIPSSKSVQHRISSVLRFIHDDKVIGRKLIYESGSDFRSICRHLQQICSTACSLSTLRKYNDQDASKYVDLAEFALVELVQINYNRSNLLNRKKDDDDNSARNNSEENQAKSRRLLTGWFNQLVEGLTPSSISRKSKKEEEEEADERALRGEIAIDDATLQSMKRLLKNVLTSIASTTKTETPFHEDPKSERQLNTITSPEEHEKVALRMINLLDKASSMMICDCESVQCVMDVLARTGTLKSARLCNEIYQKFIVSNPRIPFDIVLEGYLEAIKRGNDEETLLDIVEEVLDVLVTQWNSGISTHRAERILQCSIVLNCLAAAKMGKVVGMCETGELLIKRALGGKGFSQFLEEIQSGDPKIDYLILPTANYLAQLYATSGQKKLEKAAANLLKYSMHDPDGFNGLTIYPTSETCNAVLLTLVQSATEENSTSATNDYTFARKILHFMFTKTEMGCCPNTTTYDCLFKLLEAVNPKCIGIVGEELLSYIETSNMFCVSSNFSLPLYTYHRVLQYYLQMAKNPETMNLTDEQSLPYRRAAYLLRKLEVRSTPMVLNYAVVGEVAVENLYFPKLRPIYTTYLLVMQICANTSPVQYREEAADIAIEIYRTMSQRDFYIGNCWDVVLENCANEKLSEKVQDLKM